MEANIVSLGHHFKLLWLPDNSSYLNVSIGLHGPKWTSITQPPHMLIHGTINQQVSQSINLRFSKQREDVS